MNKRFLKILFAACTAAVVLLPAAVQAQQRDIMLVLDNSGSMKKNDPEFLTSVAVKTFIRNLGGDTQLGILIFDEAVDVAVPLTPINVDTRGRFLDSLSAITFRGQWTHSSAALERALYELRNTGRLLAEKSIVFMTDGIVDTGDAARDVERTRWIQTELAASAAESGVRVFGIAFTDNADFQLIQSLAHRSGGEYYRAYQATDIERVFESIDAALREPGPAEVAALPPTPVPVADALPTPTLPQATTIPPEMPAPAATTPEPTLTPEPEAPTVSEPVPSLALPGEPVMPTPAVPVPTLPQAGDETPESGTGAGFLAELNAPDPPPAPTPADEQPEVDSGAQFVAEPAQAEPSQSAEPVPDTSATADLTLPVPAPPGLPMSWLLAGGGALAVLVGAALFVFLRRRQKPEAVSQVPKAFLNDLAGATDKSSHELGAAPTVVGRLHGPEDDGNRYIVIDESTIGRRHAIVDYTEHAYWVADQNSLNGTFVNGRRIKERTRLKHGDRIRFHRKEFEFVLWEMFETDRTEMSPTRFTNMLEDDDDEATQMRGKPHDRESTSSTTTDT